jgi:beta,beta-carotene 9',10'-dioxygenase
MATAMSQTPKTDHRLGFTSLEEETAVDSLPVVGELPAWLTGALVRVTPAKLEVGERRLDHWFDGIAMLNRFGIAEGRVSYKSRFIDSVAYRDAQDGEWRHGGFATDPCRSLFKRVQSIFSPDMTDNPNVNMARIGERYIAMTETPMPIAFDAETLETAGRLEYADRLKAHVTTAHPHHDPERDELVNYHAFFSRVSKYVLYGLPAGSSARRVIAELPVKEPSYMHAFGMSGRHLILAEYPLRVNPLKLVFGGKPFIQNYVWRPQESTKFQVIDRETGALRGTYETEGFFCFHHVNAFERAGGSELVIDLIAYDDPSVIDALYLGPDEPRGPIPSTELRRYVIDLDGGGVTWEKFAEDVELPRIDYGRHNARPYRYVYCSRSADRWFDRLVKVDVSDGSESVWSAPGCHPGEPIFVRKPGTDDEDAGVVLSVVLDAAAGRSFLLVLDAHGFEELARAEAPHHIPFGFHGQFVRA